MQDDNNANISNEQIEEEPDIIKSDTNNTSSEETNSAPSIQKKMPFRKRHKVIFVLLIILLVIFLTPLALVTAIFGLPGFFLFFLLLFSPIISFFTPDTVGDIPISAYEVMYEEETHGGFLGDGHTIEVYRFKEEERTDLYLNDTIGKDGWHDLPLSENIEYRIYGGKKENESRSPSIFSEYLPEEEMTNGRWYFEDRHSEAIDPYSDEHFMDDDRYSANFTIIIVDDDTNTLYHYSLDT